MTSKKGTLLKPKISPNKKRFFAILSLQILLICLIGVYFLVDFEKLSFFNDEANKIFLEQDKSCNLHEEDCTIKLNKTQTITFSISPKHIPLMKTLTFQATTTNVTAKELKLKIYATNMNMGIHKFTLKKTKDNKYQGTGILPTCIVGDMIWNAEILSNDFLNDTAGRFIFKTDI